MLTSANQQNELHWERVDPPWELPDYVSDLAQALQVTNAWIASGGIIGQVVVVDPQALPQPSVLSEGESEVRTSDEECPSSCQPVSKVWQSDDVEHILDKGVWAATGAKHKGWRIFIKVNLSSSS